MKTKNLNNFKTCLIGHVVCKNMNIEAFLNTYVDYNLINCVQDFWVFLCLYRYGTVFMRMNELCFEKMNNSQEC